MFPELTHDDVFRFETRRLWLRWPTMRDAKPLVALADDAQVAEMTATLPHPYTLKDAERFVLKAREANTDGAGLSLIITRHGKSSQPLGAIGVHRDEEGEAFIGFWLGREHWGKGYATEALQGLLDVVFTLSGEDNVSACARSVNVGSKRVLEKGGFAYQGSSLKPFAARGTHYPVDTYRLNRRAWAGLHAWGALGALKDKQRQPSKVWSGEAVPA